MSTLTVKFEHDGQSVLVSNMRAEARYMDTFPVLIGDEVAHFHDVSGGYNRREQYDVVNLIHRVQGVGSPHRVNTDELSRTFEAHLSDNYYHLSVDGIRQHGEYPDEDYVLSLKVDSKMHGEYSFSEAMTENIDKRETKYEQS